jgi:uncharacterized protein
MNNCPTGSVNSFQGPTSTGDDELIRRLLGTVSTVHMAVEKVVLGSRFVGLWAGNRVGLAATLGSRPTAEEDHLATSLVGRPLSQVAGLLQEKTIISRSIGLAALNACLGKPPIIRHGGVQDLLPELAQGKKVVVVGDFPFVPSLTKIASRLDLLELKPNSSALETQHWDLALGRCDLAIITATALLTGYLTRFMATATQATKVILGPSTPLSPVLFSLGADILAGSLVARPGPVFGAIAAGESFRTIKLCGVDLICWPKPETARP